MSTDYRAFRGIWIPAEVWLSQDMTLQEKVMLVEINSLQHPERGCYKSNRALAEFFGLSAPRVTAVIASLAKKGLVHVELVRKGKQVVERRIFMTHPFGVPKGGGQDPDEGWSGSKGRVVRIQGEGWSGNDEESNTVLRGSLRGPEEVTRTIGQNRPTAPDSPGPKPPAYPAEFEATWKVYPRRAGGNPKVAAFKAWQARRKAGVTAQELHAGVVRYAGYVRDAGKSGTEYVKQAATFFGPGEHFRDEYEEPTPDWMRAAI